MVSKKVLQAIRNLVTVEDLKDIFDKSSTMTIYLWREEKGLSACEVVIPGRGRDTIRFDLDDVLLWAKNNNIETPGLEQWREENQR